VVVATTVPSTSSSIVAFASPLPENATFPSTTADPPSVAPSAGA
jgi:hypothetical protein